MEKRITRNTNMELLRIFSIILILLHHYAYHNELYTLAANNINKYIGIVAFSLGKIGVNLFVMITGYFMIEKEMNIKKIIKIWLQVEFYIVLIMIVVYIFKLNDVLSIKETIKLLMPIMFNKYWFITSYFGLYLIIPFLNKILNSLNHVEYKKLLIILTSIFVMGYSVVHNSQFVTTNDPISYVVLFAFLYSWGGYIKKYGITFFEKIDLKRLLLMIIGIFIIYEGFLIFTDYLSTKNPMFNNYVAYYINCKSIFVFALTIVTFYYFKKINIKSNFINTVASLTLGVYLFQSHQLFGGKILYKKLINTEAFYNSHYLILHMLISCLIICLIGLLIDLIRQKLVVKQLYKINIVKKYFN